MAMNEETFKPETDHTALANPWIYILLGIVSFPFFFLWVTPLWVVGLVTAIAKKARAATIVSCVLLLAQFISTLGMSGA